MRIIFFCLFFLTALRVAAQTKKPVLVNEVPVINLAGNTGLDTAVGLQSYNVVSSNRSHRTLQSQNLCSVTASFSPGVDSFFVDNKNITFTNTSVNASNVQWFINGLNFYTNSNDFNYFFRPGLYQVSLVASNGNCRDTFSVMIVCSGYSPSDDHSFYGTLGLLNNGEQASCISPAKDGGFMVAGNTDYKTYPGSHSNGILIKLKKKNCIEWSKMLTNSMIAGVCALRDSGFLVCGSTTDYRNFVLRIDKTGAMVWAKTYDLNPAQFIVWGIKHVYEMSDGSLIATTSPFSNGFFIIKMNAQGNVLWDRFLQKELEQFDYTTSTSILEWKNELYVAGNFKMPDTSLFESGPFNSFLVKLNPVNGQTIWSKMYQNESYYRSNYFQDLQPADNINLFSTSINYYTAGGGDVFPSFQWLDTSGNIFKCISFTQNQYVPNFPTMLSGGVLPGGNVLFQFNSQEKIGLQPGYINHYYYLKVADSSTLFQKEPGGGTTGTFNGEALASIGTGESQLTPWMIYSENISFSKQDSTGQNECTYASAIFEGHAFHLDQLPVAWAKNISLGITGVPYSLEMADVYPQIRSTCPDYIDSCAILKITGEQSICSLSDTYIYKAGRNSKCGQPVEWNYEGPLTVVKKTDSSLTVRFNSFGMFKISVRLRNSCNPMMDSLFVLAESKTAPLELGADTSLCPNSSFVLHASPYFLSYEWQDGSHDSLLTVSSPGRYWVRVIDSCGNLISDTLQITATSAIPINVGPDRTKCNADTIHLEGPAGFLNYAWSNNYNISSTDSRKVTVNPAVDTAYYLKAEKTAGCFAFDTVRIKVYKSPSINLGADKSFCSGDSTVIDAGSGFAEYLWSSGSSYQTLTIFSSGSYSVIGTTSEGCRSSDTMRVLNVWQNPLVTVDNNPQLCVGSARILQPGNFASYLWQDGSTNSSFVARDLGMYSVEVTDNNQCKGTDTVHINTWLPSPANFLSADTSICNYGNLLLKPSGDFKNYKWSDNTTSSSILITVPGIYWLQVTDADNCVGRDSIVVNPKECLTGFYIPNAFTPNQDGKNDVFRPLIGGTVIQYQFTVYNRWGQIVFRSKDLHKGWDGSLGGIKQNSDVFVWLCTYQIDGMPAKTERGTVVLIR
jgi:gliding motility-associated-like protein